MAVKTQMIYEDWLTLPNALTFLRIILSPYIAFLMVNNRYKEGILWIFMAGVTDFLDGFLARKLGQSSAMGAALDPLADKIFIFILFSTCIYLKWLPLWFGGLVVAREIIILGGILLLSYKGISVATVPLFSSKMNTSFQFLLLGCVMLGKLYPLNTLSTLFLIATTSTTFYSGWQYACVGISALKRGRN